MAGAPVVLGMLINAPESDKRRFHHVVEVATGGQRARPQHLGHGDRGRWRPWASSYGVRWLWLSMNLKSPPRRLPERTQQRAPTDERVRPRVGLSLDASDLFALVEPLTCASLMASGLAPTRDAVPGREDRTLPPLMVVTRSRSHVCPPAPRGWRRPADVFRLIVEEAAPRWPGSFAHGRRSSRADAQRVSATSAASTRPRRLSARFASNDARGEPACGAFHHVVRGRDHSSITRPLRLRSRFAAMEAMGFNVTHLYGLTEVYGPALVAAPQEGWEELPLGERAALMARQGVRHHAIRGAMVADSETLAPVPADGATVGEIMLRGNTVMKGYLDDAGATADAFRGGWFHSGDLASHAPGRLHPDHRPRQGHHHLRRREHFEHRGRKRALQQRGRAGGSGRRAPR